MLISSKKYILILYCSFTVLVQGGQVRAASAQHSHGEPVLVDSTPSLSIAATGTTNLDLLPTPEPPVFPQSIDKGCDIVMLLDTADSVTAADPSNFRKDALKLFLSLLSEDDRVSIMRFGKDATALGPLTQNTEQNRPALFSEIDLRNSLDRILPAADAVQAGYDALKKSNRQKRVIVLLINGKTAPGAHEKTAGSLSALNALIPRLIADHVRIYAIAFPGDSDRESLASLAGETGGGFQTAQAAQDLHLAFSSVYEKLKTPDTLPVAGDVFTIDGDIREATVLVSKKTGTTVSLTNPSGAQESLARHSRQTAWQASMVYDLITLRNPLPGAWRISMSRHEGNKVYLQTELRLGAAFDRMPAHRGENISIEIWLEKKGVMIAEPTVLGLLSMTASAVDPEGKTIPLRLAPASNPGNGSLKAGTYSGVLAVNREGIHTVKISATGRTFFREKVITLAVADSPEDQQPGHAPKKDKISWWNVIARFVLVNIAVALLIGIVFFIRTLKMKMTAKRAKK